MAGVTSLARMEHRAALEGVGFYEAVFANAMLVRRLPSVGYASSFHKLAIRGSVLMGFTLFYAPGARDFGVARHLAPAGVGGVSSAGSGLLIIRANWGARGMGVGLLRGLIV